MTFSMPYAVVYLLSSCLPPNDFGSRIRFYLIRHLLKSYGTNILIPARCHIFNPAGLEIGDNSYLGYNSYYGQGEIKIGKNVLVGPYVSVTASNHVRLDGNFRNSNFLAKKIVIEDDVWIGAHSCILAGVTIGKGAVVAAGSVVNKSVPPNTTVGGVPAHDI